MVRTAIVAILGVCLCGSSGFAQSVFSSGGFAPATSPTQSPTSSADLLRVFLDCAPCDSEFIKTAINFVTFVTDRTAAEVEVTGNAEATADGSRKWSFVVAGRSGKFADQKRPVTVVTTPSQSVDDVRAAVARVLRLGLTEFAALTSVAPQLDVTHRRAQNAPAATPTKKDPWNYWFFRIGVSGNRNGEQSSSFSNFWANASANRTTENWKMRISTNRSVEKNSFNVEDEDGEGDLQFTSRTSNWGVDMLLVKSVGAHWSAAMASALNSSSFSNEHLTGAFGPGIEYDVFPYSESSKRSWTIQYNVYTTHYDYAAETIFGKFGEVTVSHELSSSLGLQQKWGSVGASCTFSQQLQHLEREHVDFFGHANVRITKGLSVNGFASFSRIRDQFTLPKGDASEEDVLLRLRQLATGHRFSMSVGISYSFGALSNATVNPRFNN